MAGVVRASLGRRCAALLVDLAVPLLLVAAAIAFALQAVPQAVPWWLLLLVALALVAVQVVVLALQGRTLGRLLLRQRTVDDLTGMPVRPGRIVGAIRTRGSAHLVTADLRRGRDPLDVRAADDEAQASTTLQSHTPTAPTAVPSSRSAPDPPSSVESGRPATESPATISTGASAPPVVGPASSTEIRPTVGIVLDTGERYEVAGALVLGRSPVDPSGSADRTLVAWPDLTRRLAKTHALLEWSGTELWVTDLGSASGTAVIAPGGDRRPLAPGVRSVAAVGATIECGGRGMKVVPGG